MGYLKRGSGGAAADDNALSAATPNQFDDLIGFYDLSAGAMRKVALGALFNPLTSWGIEDEFLSIGVSGGDGINGVIASVSGSGAQAVLGTGDRSHPGVVDLSTGTTATGRAGFIATPATQIRLGGGRTRFMSIIRIGALSDGTETYVLRSGFGDTASAEFTDGVFFRYTHSEVAGDWQGICRSNGVETVLDTNIAVAAATWYRLEFEVNAAGTSVEFFINGTSVGTVTTNIPTAAGRETGIVPINAIKSVGTTSRTFEIDYYSAGGEFTTPR